MIHPLLPYAIQGAIWYQGESNAGRAFEYRTLLMTMIKDWRAAWGEADFPFLIVQWVPFRKIRAEPADSDWAEPRQRNSWRPSSCEGWIGGDYRRRQRNGHSSQTEGTRAFAWPWQHSPLADGEKIVYSGPMCKELKVEGNRAIVSFEHVGSGLVAKGGPLLGFSIAGDDHKFVRALAEIQDDHVVVSSPQVPKPVAVRFGWADYPVVNLWNKEGLP